METLSSAQRELVALGAALASNCVPCIEYHVPEARKAGLTDEQLKEVIKLADKVRQVPARKVLKTALDFFAPAEEASASPKSTSTEAQPTSHNDVEQPCCA